MRKHPSPTTTIIAILWLLCAMASTAGGRPAADVPEPGLEEPEPPAIWIQAVGDLMLAGSAEPVMRAKGYAYAFSGTRHVLRLGDINIANLEAPITTRGSETRGKQFTFRQPPGLARAIRDAGFHLLHLANNHMVDFGQVGLADTMGYLNRMGLKTAGCGRNLEVSKRPAIITANGVSVGYLGFTMTFPKSYWAQPDRPGCTYASFERIVGDVRELRERVDVVVVGFHWSSELRPNPKVYQIKWAHEVIDQGADIVLGHHPHVLQGVERYHGKPIFYSLGNYAFGSRSRKATTSVMVRVRIRRDREILQVSLVPLDVANHRVEFNPRVAKGALAEQIRLELEAKSRGFGAGFRLDERGVIQVVRDPNNIDPAHMSMKEER